MGEHLILSQLANDEADVCLGFFEGLLVGVDQELLEVAVYNFAFHLLEVPNQLEKVFLHEFMDKSQKERIMKLGRFRARKPSVQVTDESPG